MLTPDFIAKPPAVFDRRCGRRQSKYETAAIPSQNHRNPNSADTWGDKIKSKKDNIVRVCFNNINHIGQSRDSYKTTDLKEFIQRRDIDMMCLAELGVYWPSIPDQDRLWERTQDWSDYRRIATAYNTLGHQSRSQYGGTAILGLDFIVQKINTCGYDDSGLGRWCWMMMKGKNDTTTRVVSAYCPVRSNLTGKRGHNTVFAQQLRILSQDPIKAFWDDLGKALQQWINNGEQIVLCGDWNTHVLGQDITTFMNTFGLKEAITHIHGTRPPETFIRGKKTIDGIFVTSTLLGIRGGYLSYDDAPGDHRGLWVDIPEAAILGHKLPTAPAKKPRKLRCNDPRSKRKYKEKLHTFLHKHNIYGRILELKSTVQAPMTTENKAAYNKIDKAMEKYKEHAQDQCRKVYTGGIDFSDVGKDIRLEINLWKLVKNRLEGSKVNARTIIRARKRTNIQDSNVSMEVAKEKLDNAFHRNRIARKQHRALRKRMLYNLAAAQAKEGNIKVATAIKNKAIQEESRREARRTKAVLKRNANMGTTRIQIEKSGRTIDITDKEEMERLIISENEKKYHQTEESCPLLRGQLLDDIGIKGDGPAVADILAGEYEYPEGTTQAVKLWLDNLYVPDLHYKEPTIETIHEYRKGWKNAKEWTSSGSLHFGHFKAGAEDDMICWANYIMATLPRATGFVPERWKKGTDVMLLKKEGSYGVDKLRTIVLLEADFNQENKRLGREAMHLALKQNLLTDEQYSRPGRSSQDNALNKRLLFDYQRLRRQPYAICACDLKSCYDRIVHNAAVLALRRAGIRQSDISSMFGTIQTMIHKVRTAFGDSNDTYKGDNPMFLHPVQGACQGNGAGPSIWALICSTVFEVLKKEGYSSTFCYAISCGCYQLCGFAYVDDCDLVVAGEEIQDILHSIQSMLTLWDEVMEVTGAAIATDKCWWYAVKFLWNKGRWKMVDAGNKHTLKVRDKNKVMQTINYLPNDTAKEMLGVFLAPNGNQNEQIVQLRNKSSDWSRHIASGFLRPKTAWTALNTTILKSLEYPLVATTLNRTQIRYITAPALMAGLPASGFCRTFPRAVLYGPPELQGLNVQNLFITQAVRHVKDIIDQTWKKTPGRNFIQSNTESMKLEVGLTGPLFELDVIPTWINTPNLWVMHTLKFCIEYDIKFKETGKNIQAKRIGDKTIMHLAQQLHIQDNALKAINRCRMYLNVTTVSDIVTGDGQYTHPDILAHRKIGKTDSFHWPFQGLPSPDDWKWWDYAIDLTLKRGTTLDTPLGHWTLPQQEFINDWEYFLTSQNKLYRHLNNTWTRYRRKKFDRGRQLRFDTTNSKTKRHPPRGTLWRTTVTITNKVITTQGKDYNVPPIPPILPLRGTIQTKFRSALKQIPDAAWICTNIRGMEHLEKIVNGIKHGTFVGVSDGSFTPTFQLGSAAWIITSESDKGYLQGGGITPGTPTSHNAYRSEVAGIYGLLIILSCLQNITDMEGATITIGCDGSSALWTSFKQRHQVSSSDKAFDIMSRVIALRETINIKIIPLHVRGHQETTSKQLSFLEMANIEMDYRAKELIKAAKFQEFHPPEFLPECNYGIPIITIQDEMIHNNLLKTLKQKAAGQDLRQWWIDKGRFTPQASQLIDWKMAKTHMETSTWHQKKFITKWISGQLPVGTRAKIIGTQEYAECPRCDYPAEDNHHVLECGSKGSRKVWHKALKNLDSWLRKIGTDPDIVRAIMLIIPRWHCADLQSTYCPGNINNEVQQAVREQHIISWNNFMDGLWSTRWAKAQEMYYKTKKRRNTGNRWAAKVSARIWSIKKEMWDHRNAALYRSSGITKTGKEELYLACQQELEIGRQRLPAVFDIYFEYDIDSLKEEKLRNVKSWFSTIRRAREKSGWNYDDQDLISDSLRKWVGLTTYREVRSRH